MVRLPSEVAIKLAVQYWRNRGMPQKQELVALEHGVSSDTVGAMSVGADSDSQNHFTRCAFPCIACIPPIVSFDPVGRAGANVK